MKKHLEAAESGRLFALEANTIEGQPKSLADYKGKVLMIVNTASQCGFTRQYQSLEELYRRYKEYGFKILAFPSNDFGNQEPGSDAEIRDFCVKRYSTTFDLFSKVRVKGKNIHPLYHYLTDESGFKGDIAWNFTKFLVNREGRVVARFGPNAEPTSMSVVGKIQGLL